MSNKNGALAIFSFLLTLAFLPGLSWADSLSEEQVSAFNENLRIKGQSSYEMTPEEVLESLNSFEDDNAAQSFEGVIRVDGRDVIQDWVNEDLEDADATQGRAARSTNPRNELWIDVYQESPVDLKYVRRGESYRNWQSIPLREDVKMSFAVVTRISGGVKNFVRAHLVSTGSANHRSAEGTFSIHRRHRYYTSRTYGSRMDFAQFFIGGIALHQTDTSAYSILGGPASHGCIRHHKYDANAVWNLVGAAIERGDTVNVKVSSFGARVASYTPQDKLTKSLNRSIMCTRYARRYIRGAGYNNNFCSTSNSLHNYNSLSDLL